MTESTSGKQEINSIDIQKLGRNALIYGIGGALAYLAAHIQYVDFGDYKTLIAPVAILLVDGFYRWYRDNNKVEKLSGESDVK